VRSKRRSSPKPKEKRAGAGCQGLQRKSQNTGVSGTPPWHTASRCRPSSIVRGERDPTRLTLTTLTTTSHKTHDAGASRPPAPDHCSGSVPGGSSHRHRWEVSHKTPEMPMQSGNATHRTGTRGLPHTTQGKTKPRCSENRGGPCTPETTPVTSEGHTWYPRRHCRTRLSQPKGMRGALKRRSSNRGEMPNSVWEVARSERPQGNMLPAHGNLITPRMGWTLAVVGSRTFQKL